MIINKNLLNNKIEKIKIKYFCILKIREKVKIDEYNKNIK